MDGKIVIACVDDECRTHLLAALKPHGLSFHSVSEDADLLLEVLEKDFDIIIYDLEIANLDGVKMVKILRKIRPKVALVVISNDPSTELGGKILQEGVAYYAVKPINPEAVKGAVLSAVSKKKIN